MGSGSRRPICVDLFCGAGGLSEGLKQAGFRTVLAVDFDKHCLKTYQRNHPDAATLCEDVTLLPASAILDAAGGQEIDLLSGGPSCQGYSTHGKRDEEDPRNFLFEHFVRLVGEVRPKWVMMENVPGLLTYRGGHFKRLITDAFTTAGYRVGVEVMTAADYGVPQLRRRIIFLATRTDSPITFPRPTHAEPRSDLFKADLLPYVTVCEAIGDLPLMRGQLERDDWRYLSSPSCDYQKYVRGRTPNITLHRANGISPQASKVVEFIKEGQGLRSVPVEHLPDRFKKMRRISDGSLRSDCTTLYYRLDRNRPAYTITCYFRNVASGPFLHPLENRSLSFREAARLMSFQDGYEFLGPGLPRQIGNAVPPLLAKAIGKHLIGLLKAEKPGRRLVLTV
jgi:DNA (cytosine-5)-methyltransferase 1